MFIMLKKNGHLHIYCAYESKSRKIDMPEAIDTSLDARVLKLLAIDAVFACYIETKS